MRPLLLLLIFLTVAPAIAQNIAREQPAAIIGSVKDNAQNRIPGIHIIIDGLQQGAVSDNKGNYELTNIKSGNYILEISGIGYQTIKETISLKAGQRLRLNIVMAETTKTLNEVVVTGQHSPQSARNSVYKVRTIDKKRLEQQGANNLQDVLANELNIRFSRDNALGTSGLSIQGITGQNVKVLINGVPMVGRSGVSNEIDINQININTIERIEIVEGPMAVNFGADALAGVINIITKKGTGKKLALDFTLQEETVERHYSFFDEGIHNANLSIGTHITNKFYVQAEGRINQFGGWVGDTASYTDRNRQWLPKKQYFGGALMRYTAEDFSINYRVDYLNEVISNLGVINDLDPNREPFAADREFITHRGMHQLQADWQLGKWLLNPVLSFTDYQRGTEAFTTFVESELENNRREIQNTFYKTLFFRNTASLNALSWGSLQLGVDASFDQGGGSTLSTGEKQANDIAFFASSEIKLSSKLAARAGVRYGYNSLYTVQPSPSINLKYDATAKTQIRVGYGRGFRVPSLRELYHEFIDSNHNLIGNPELSPEYSHNINADVTHTFSGVNLTTAIAGFYNHINDRITFFTPQESNAATTYFNLEEFRSTGATFTAKWQNKHWNLSSGATYIGRYQRLNAEADVPGFIFNWEANTVLSYKLPVWQTTFSGFYKFNGPLRDYRLTDPDGDGESSPELVGIDGFHLLDFSINQKIGASLSCTIGARNLLNVTAINNSTSDGTHSGVGGMASVGYGTSYFLRINYQFKTNK